jgi:hypothetical protein
MVKITGSKNFNTSHLYNGGNQKQKQMKTKNDVIEN